MYVDRREKAEQFILKVINGDIEGAKQIIKELREFYEYLEMDLKYQMEIIALFDFPIEKEVEICIHEDSIILVYDTLYTYNNEEIKGERMFYLWDIDSLKYLRELLVYLKCKIGKCYDCRNR